MEEPLSALHDPVRQGKVPHSGCSNLYDAKAHWIAARGLTPFVSCQDFYNLLYRDIEKASCRCASSTAWRCSHTCPSPRRCSAARIDAAFILGIEDSDPDIGAAIGVATTFPGAFGP